MKLGIKEALLSASLLAPTLVGYGINTAVQAASHSTRDDIAALGQAIELNSYIWGNGSIDPTNYWTRATQESE